MPSEKSTDFCTILLDWRMILMKLKHSDDGLLHIWVKHAYDQVAPGREERAGRDCPAMAEEAGGGRS
jgi:hypothetical protein